MSLRLLIVIGILVQYSFHLAERSEHVRVHTCFNWLRRFSADLWKGHLEDIEGAQGYFLRV